MSDRLINTSFKFAMVTILLGCCSVSCSRHPVVQLSNQTGSTQRIQLAMPYPGGKIGVPHDKYDIVVSPNDTWRSDLADEASHSNLQMELINGPLVLRLKPVTCTVCDWIAFDCGFTEFVSIAIEGKYPDIHLVARDRHGGEIIAEETSFQWFK